MDTIDRFNSENRKNSDCFQYAIDAIHALDYAGYSNWAHKKREALFRLTFAQNLHEIQLSDARTKGIVFASIVFASVNVLSILGFAYYTGLI